MEHARCLAEIEYVTLREKLEPATETTRERKLLGRPYQHPRRQLGDVYLRPLHSDRARDHRDQLIEREMLRPAKNERLTNGRIARGEQLEPAHEILDVDRMHACAARAWNHDVSATHRRHHAAKAAVVRTVRPRGTRDGDWKRALANEEQ